MLKIGGTDQPFAGIVGQKRDPDRAAFRNDDGIEEVGLPAVIEGVKDPDDMPVDPDDLKPRRPVHQRDDNLLASPDENSGFPPSPDGKPKLRFQILPGSGKRRLTMSGARTAPAGSRGVPAAGNVEFRPARVLETNGIRQVRIRRQRE